jgi:hypothetical protein
MRDYCCLVLLMLLVVERWQLSRVNSINPMGCVVTQGTRLHKCRFELATCDERAVQLVQCEMTVSVGIGQKRFDSMPLHTLA